MKLLAGVSLSLLAVLALSLVFFVPLFDQAAQAQSSTTANGIRPIGKPVEIKAPLGLPPVPIPADNLQQKKRSRWDAGFTTTPSFR